MSAAAMARAFGLGFVPLQQMRYDIVIPKEYLHDALVEQLLHTLISHRFRAQLKALGGYDTGHTADVVATLEPGSTLSSVPAGETVTAEAMASRLVARR